MGVINDLYIPARVRRSDAELDEWTGVAPLPQLKTAPPQEAQAPPNISMTMTPKGPAQPQPTPYGTQFPNIMADTLANIGRQVAPTLATIGRQALDAMAAEVGAEATPKVRKGLTMVPTGPETEESGLLSTAGSILDTMFNPPAVQRLISYMGGTPIATLEDAIKAGGNEKELQDWRRLPEGVRNVIESSVSNIHAMGPGRPRRRPTPGTPEGTTPPTQPGAPAAAAPRTPQIGEAPVDSLTLDPQRFQYKLIQGEAGTTGSLSGVQTYDPNLAGIVQVWRDPADGKVYVVNGHNRVALAKSKGIATIPVRYLDVSTAEEAKQVGALTNIAEGRGSPIDAAKLFREGGMTKADLEAKGIPLKEKIATEGLALSNLHESLFHEVIQGSMPLERALIIGGNVSEPDAQLKLVQLLRAEAAKGRRIGNDQVRELADFVESATTTRMVEETLFGSEETIVNLAIEKARMAAAIRDRLSTDKTLFAKVGKEKAAERLTAAGNVINVEESQRLSQESASLLQIFDKLKNATGEISDILNDAARQLQAGGKFNDIRNTTYQRLTEALPRALSGAEGPSTGGTTPGVRTGQPPSSGAAEPGAGAPTPGVEAPPATISLSGMGQAISENMYDMLWRKVTAGETTEGGQPSQLLIAAQNLRNQGQLRTIEEFKTFAQQQAGATPTPTPSRLVHIDDVTRPTDPTKPHGAYFSLSDTGMSMYTDMGDVVTHAEAMATKPLVVQPLRIRHEQFNIKPGGPAVEGQASAGVAALKALVGDTEFARLLTLKKPAILDEMNARFPGQDYEGYENAFGLLEAYAGQEARRQGFDALIMAGPGRPLYEAEYVALTPEAVRVLGTEPTAAYMRQFPEDVAARAAFQDQPPGTPPPGTPPPPPSPPEPPSPPPPGAPEPAPENLRAQAFESPGRFNPARQAASEEVTDLTAAINVRAREMGIMQEQTRGRQAWTDTEQKAHALVKSGKMSLERILALRPGDVLNAEEGLAARNIRDSAATLFNELLDAADRGDEVAKAGLEKAALLASRIETNVEAATGTEIARALAIRRRASLAYDMDDIYQRLAVRTIDPNVLHQFYQNLTDNTQRQAFTKYFEETSRLGRWTEAFLEARAGGLLSHRSFVRNLGGSAATTIWSIPLRAITAITGGPSQGAYAYEAVEMAYGMYEAQKMALVMAGRAARTGESQFLGAFTQTERPALHAMSSEALGLTGPMGRAIDVYGEIARVQFRGLVAGDDYFKFINYVGEVHALAYRQYRRLISSGTSRQDAAREYEALIANPPPWLREAAEAHSLYTTFNDDIINPVGKLIMAAREDDGPLGKIARLIVPWAKTPMNVMGYGAEITPGLNFLSSHFWQEMRSGDPIRQDAAAARVALGSSVYLVLAMLAGEGYLTGKGPTDPKLKAQYRDNGQLPYSVKLPDFPAIPFRGAEPLSAIMAQAADFAELVDQGADLPALTQMATATVLSSLDYMEDQPMLKSIAQVVDAWRQNDARANEGLMQLFASFLPVPGLQSTARIAQEQTDPLMRETRTPHGGRSWGGRQVVDLGQEIAARTPGLSNDLYPQRDILGRPMLRQGGWWSLSPNAPSAQEPHPVLTEINRHNITIGKVPKALGRGKQTMTFVGYDPDRMALELTAKEWDRFQVLSAQPHDDWPTLDQALRDLIASDRYQEGSDTARGTKATMIKEVFQEYRQEARDQLVSEGPVNAAGLTRLQEELEKKAQVREFEQMDKPEQEEARPDLELQLGRPTRIGIMR